MDSSIMVPVGVAATLALAACGTLAWRVFRPKGVVYGSDALVMQCLFCDIAHGRTDPAKGGRPADQRLQGRLLHETADVAVFCNLAVHAHLHLLAIPKQHLQNISVLGPEHIPLLQQLKAAGTEALREILANEVHEATGRRIRTPAEVEEEARNNFVFNFHVPPFNSIDHLHLHCLHLPSHGWLSGLKYNPTCRGRAAAMTCWPRYNSVS
jgi:diadenosine tetraphosphate (Ap4A) HIT family hydrolase